MPSGELRYRLLVEFNGRLVTYAQDYTILQLFENQAAGRPHSPAVTYGSRTLTYRRLNQLANALAEQLQRLGVGRGDLVPLVMRDGLELPIAMLALMKLAAPFVPVDDLWPADRLETMISALTPKIALRASTDAVLPARVASVPVDVARLPERASDDFGTPAGMDDVIYGFYTSGSTGPPKCTLNIHRGLLNRFLYMSRRFGAGADHVVLQNSRHVFDSSLWQLLWPLTNGSTVVIPERAGILDLTVTVELIRRHAVTMTDYVPSIFNTLVELLVAQPALVDHLRSMRYVLVGGEEINTGAVQTFRSLLPHVGIVNTYGPTEASIGSVFHTVTDADRESIPIGRPIDNTYVVIADERLGLVAPGEVGEIYIGGDCVGLGYLGDPEKTRAAFVDNPFPEIPGPRLYRTGDLGYHRPDGCIQFVGRRDQQVKIGGVRVELSEIELALLQHPEIREAKVILHSDEAVKRLVAFVTCRTRLAVDELRRHARSVLPHYLVPRQFVVLDRLPLSANGKADRAKLASMAALPAAGGGDVLLTASEGAVREIWLKLLPAGELTTSDNFFEYGGDSLTAQRLSLLLADRFAVRVSVRDIVAAPTIAEQAALVDGEPAAERAAEPVVSTLVRDIALPADVTVALPPAAHSPRHVLLTGATGFVGAQLLRDLLATTQATVHCLVRADDPDQARARVTRNQREYRLWREDLGSRIVAVPGDLAVPGLGLSEVDHRRLAETVDTVVHNGAMVNLVLGYHAHRATNVAGTVEILRFASASRTKPVHFVSTLGVLPIRAPGDDPAPWPETRPGPLAPADGYSQSKWVAEHVLDLAADRGVPVTVYRLGEVMPHSVTGVASRRGLPDLLVKACLRVGASFTSPIVMDYTPVDDVGFVVCSAMARGEQQYFHVVRPGVAFDALLARVRQEFGLREVSYRQFWHAVRDASAADTGDRELAGVLAVIPPADTATDTELDTRLATMLRDSTRYCATERTARLARDAARHWGAVGPEVFDSYVGYHRGLRTPVATSTR